MKNLLKNTAFVFLLIVVIQIAYKVLFLDYWGFWHDEAFSLYFSQQHWGHLKHISEWDINPPLYFYFLWIWQHLFGISEYSIRFSSVLFSALSAGMLYLICAKNFNRTAGLWAVLFFSVCNDMYFYAHEARPYTIILFLALCSSYYFFDLLQKPNWMNAIVLGILNFGLIYTHYVSGIVIAMQILTALIYFNKQTLKFLSVALGITLLIASLRFTKKTIEMVLHNKTSSFWIAKPTWHDLSDTLYSFFNGPDLFYIFLFAAGIAFIHLVRSKTWEPLWAENKIKLTYVFLAGPGALLVCFLVSLFMPLFVRRYLLFTIPFVFITFAFFISLIDKSMRAPIVALVGVFLLFSTMRIDFHTVKSMDYRGAVNLVKVLQKNNTPVLVETPDVAALFSYYYNRDFFKDYGNMEGRLREKGIYMVGNAADARMIDLSRSNRIVLTQTFEDINPGNKELLKYISSLYPNKRVSRYYRGITITVYSK